MQVVKFVIATTLFFGACSSNENAKKENFEENSEMTFYRTEDGSSVITGQCYDLESKTQILPASINLNGVVLPTENGFFKYNVLSGTYTLKAGFIGKEWVTSKIKMQKGDSVFIKIYLKDDDSPLYEK